MRQLLSLLIIVPLGLLFAFCGAQTDGVNGVAGYDDDATSGMEPGATDDSGENGGVSDGDADDSGENGGVSDGDAADLAPDVKMVALRNPDTAGAKFLVDDDRCEEMPFVVESTGAQQICFSTPGHEQHGLSLWTRDGGYILTLHAGEGCATANLGADTYVMVLCHAGGKNSSRSSLIFIADRDITGVADPDWLPADGEDYPTEYEYEDDDVLYTREPRYLDTVKFNTFLSTGVCSYCDLRAADVVGNDITLAGVTLTGSDLTGALFYDDTNGDSVVNVGDTAVDFTGANLSKARFDDAVMDMVDFTSAIMTSTSLKRVTLVDAVFTSANLTRARLDDTDVTGADFTLANLTRARMNGADATGADFTNAGMASAVLESVNFTNATMVGVNMQGAKCGEADFTNADMSTGAANANLTYAYFNNATMTNVNLTNSALTKARFNSADMTGANFTGATGTTGSTKAIFRNTILTSATWVAAEACETPPDVAYYDPVTQECEQ